MLAIKIDNPEIESRFKEYAKQQKRAVEDIASEAIKFFLDMQKRDDTLKYTKKDPTKHIVKINREYDENLCDNVALTHIQDSAKYVHELRRQKRYE